jgi:hypothetical protein
MAFLVENKAVSRREFYGTLVAVWAFLAMVASVDETHAFHTPMLALITVAALWAFIQAVRTRRTR